MKYKNMQSFLNWYDRIFNILHHLAQCLCSLRPENFIINIHKTRTFNFMYLQETLFNCFFSSANRYRWMLHDTSLKEVDKRTPDSEFLMYKDRQAFFEAVIKLFQHRDNVGEIRSFCRIRRPATLDEMIEDGRTSSR